MPTFAVLAHYGGIDEIGVFVVPAVAVILVMRWAERRARQRRDAEADVPDGGPRPGGSGDPLSSRVDE